MTDALKLFVLSIAVLVAACSVEHLFVPDVAIPIDWRGDPQPVWQVETAFLLKALEAVAALVAGLALWIGVASYVEARRRADP